MKKRAVEPDFCWPEGVQISPMMSGKMKAIGILFEGTDSPVALTIGAAREMVTLLENAIEQSCHPTNGSDSA